MTEKIIITLKISLILSILGFITKVEALVDSGLTDTTYCNIRLESFYRPEGTNKFNTARCNLTYFPTVACFYGVLNSIYYDGFGTLYPDDALLKSSSVLKLEDTDFNVILRVEPLDSSCLAEVVSNCTACSELIYNGLAIIDKYDLNGLDFSLDITSEYKEDLEKCLKLAQEVITGNGYRLVVSVPADINYINSVVDPVFLSETVELIVLKEQYFDCSSSVTVPIAPLYPLPNQCDSNSNMEALVNAWLDADVDPRKFIVTFSTSFLTFETTSCDDPSVGLNVTGPGAATDLTLTPGFEAYFEVCSDPNLSVTVADDDSYAVGVDGKRWVGGDVLATIRKKGIYIHDKKLKGVGISNVCDDDYNGRCGGRNLVVITATNTALYGFDPAMTGIPESGRGAASVGSEGSELLAPDPATVRSTPGLSIIA